MSMAAIRWAFEQVAKAGAKLVLLCLAWHADRDGKNAFPGVETISTETNQDERTVRRHLDSLVEIGLVTRHRRHVEQGPRKGERLPDAFELKLPSGLPGDLPGCGEPTLEDTTGHFDRDNRAICQGQPGNLSAVYRMNPVLEPSKRTQSSIEGDLFPDKSKKQPAKKDARKQTAKPDSPMPANWPDAALRSEAIEFWNTRDRPDLAQDVDHHAEQARNNHAAKASRFVDWTAAWRTWYRNTVRYERRPADRATGASARRSNLSIVAEKLLTEVQNER